MLLELKDIEVNYISKEKEIKALNKISFKIKKGIFLSVIGPSGCGKTTLLKVIAGLINPTKGRIIKPKKFEIGYVFQDSNLLKWKKVIDNVALPLVIKGIKKEKAKKKAREFLELVDLKDFENAYPKELSGGMRHRVAIARALSYNPEILLMDEPFGALDELTRLKLNVELNKIWMKTNKTIVFVTHNVNEAVFLSSKIVILSKRPAVLKKIIDIDLPKQRTLELLDSEKYMKLVLEIRKIFSQ